MLTHVVIETSQREHTNIDHNKRGKANMSLRGYQQKRCGDRGLLSFDDQAAALRRNRMSRMKKIDVPGPHKTIEERTPENLEYYYSLIAAAQQKRMALFKKNDDQRKATSAPPEVNARQENTAESTEEASETTVYNVNEGLPREIRVYEMKQKKSRKQSDEKRHKKSAATGHSEQHVHLVTKMENWEKSRTPGRSRSRKSTRKEVAQRKTCCLSVSTQESSESESTCLDITERTDDDDELIITEKLNTPTEPIELPVKWISLKERIRLLKRNQEFWNNHPARFGRAQPGRHLE
jgi:hypothetical protein